MTPPDVSWLSPGFPHGSMASTVACAALTALAGAGEELGLAERLLSLQGAVHQHVLWEAGWRGNGWWKNGMLGYNQRYVHI